MTCRECGAQTPLNLCRRCTADLRAALIALVTGPERPDGHSAPGLLDDLRDTATGQAHGAGSIPIGHHSPGETRGNPRAVQLLADARATMARIAASLPVSDAIMCNAASLCPPDFIGPLRPTQRRKPAPAYQPSADELAIWLAGHVSAIATRPDAKRIYRTIRHLTRRILATIDRPPTRQPLGPCLCGQPLTAPPDATRVTCGHCGIIHETDELTRAQLRRVIATGHGFTRDEFPVAMAILGSPISPRTFRRWRHEGRLPIIDYRDGEPLYSPADLPKTRA